LGHVPDTLYLKGLLLTGGREKGKGEQMGRKEEGKGEEGRVGRGEGEGTVKKCEAQARKVASLPLTTTNTTVPDRQTDR